MLSFTSASAASAATGHSLFHSRQLWATIDVCNPIDQPDTLGIRGSMPSDGFASDTMYMRFRLQYLNTATKHWIDLIQRVARTRGSSPSARPPPRARPGAASS